MGLAAPSLSLSKNWAVPSEVRVQHHRLSSNYEDEGPGFYVQFLSLTDKYPHKYSKGRV